MTQNNIELNCKFHRLLPIIDLKIKLNAISHPLRVCVYECHWKWMVRDFCHVVSIRHTSGKLGKINEWKIEVVSKFLIVKQIGDVVPAEPYNLWIVITYVFFSFSFFIGTFFLWFRFYCVYKSITQTCTQHKLVVDGFAQYIKKKNSHQNGFVIFHLFVNIPLVSLGKYTHTHFAFHIVNCARQR